MNSLINEFIKLYPKHNPETAFCPYRICPLGAHIDHQHGKVIGMAIDKGIKIAFCPTENGVVELVSKNFEKKVEFHVEHVLGIEGDWADYLRGATASLFRKYALRYGMYAVIEGSMPIGGLSSSAAVIIAYLQALCKANKLTLPDQELIDVALWAEKDFVGVNVGKLDQSCEVLSRKDHLLYLDTQNGAYELIPTDSRMKPYEIAIFFSGLERTLVGSKYNMRVDEMKSASYALKAFAGMEYGKFADSRMREVPVEIFHKYKGNLPENWRRRAEHFYTEFKRVEEGAEAWKKGDIDKFGRLSYESCRSSISNYETGSEEFRTLYKIMLRTDGIYGGRFSGAGFKGSCMALIDPGFRESIEKKVTTEYLKAYPELAGKFSVHFCKNADGVGIGK